MASILDSRIYRNIFGTDEVRRIFEDAQYIQYMIDVETALARAQSELQVIPRDVGQVLTASCQVSKLDLDRLAAETEIVGYPILPLIRQLNEMSPSEAAKYIHWGATTQDIMDTASVLQMQKGLGLIRKEMNELRNILGSMARRYRDTPMAGRTHLQQALPITWGYKCAVYLSSIERHLERLDQLEERTLLVQLGGAAGSLASLGSDDTGVRVRQRLAQELHLGDPPITWHVARDNVAEIINFLALIGGSLGKIAFDIILMSSNEIGEVAEPFVPHRGASSTMPQKRNPISSEVILAASKMLRANAGLALDAMVCDFERASGPWHLEWAVIPEAFVIACGALHQTNFALAGLVVHTDTMAKNLDSTRGSIVGEAVMMGLGPLLGRQRAHDVVYAACRECNDSDRALADVLLEHPVVKEHMQEDRIRELCSPVRYLGACGLMVDTMTTKNMPA